VLAFEDAVFQLRDSVTIGDMKQAAACRFVERNFLAPSS
jgi:hypothetical protein